MVRLKGRNGVVVFILVFICYGAKATASNDKVEYIRLPLFTFDRPDNGQTKSTPTHVASTTNLPTTSTHFVRNELASGHELAGESRSVTSQPLPTSPLNSSTIANITALLDSLTGGLSEEEDENDEEIEENESAVPTGSAITDEVEEDDHVEEDDDKSNLDVDKNENVGQIKGKGRDDVENEDDEQLNGNGSDDDIEDEEPFNELDLIDMVQELEYQADMEEQTGIFPEILDILHGKQQNKQGNGTGGRISTTTPFSIVKSSEEEEGISNITSYKSGVISRSNGTLRISLNEDGDLELGSEDLSEFSEEIVDGISEGVEESLRMFGDFDDAPMLMNDNDTAQNRQFSVYLFQGQYYAEPRLNRFIDGALRNMGTELRVSAMDPLFFRVLPRGQVAERERPIVGNAAAGGVSGMRRRRPVIGASGGIAIGRQLPAFFRFGKKKKRPLQQGRKKPLPNRAKRNKVAVGGVQTIKNVGGVNPFLRKRLQQQKLAAQRRRRQRFRQQRLKQQLKNRLKKQQQQKNKNKFNQNLNKNNKNKQQLLQRIRRRTRQDVGGGRIEGLSRVQRDGDAEMQLFGNYTLIRSHMKMGPVELTMQFRTKNGIRRSGATLPVIRAHTVTRVNHEGSEMIDYLLDRPHPESIRVRGTLYPLAQRVARNIFARLFLPNSFLTTKLREKASMAYLSRPGFTRGLSHRGNPYRQQEAHPINTYHIPEF